MKKLIIIIMLVFGLFDCSLVQASEIFGKISTNPKNIPIPPSVPPTSVPNETKTQEQDNPASGSQSAVGIFFPKQNVVNNVDANVKVLGIKYYPDHTLLRGSNKRIYIIEGLVKKHIINLDELRKYQGQKIFDVSDADLSLYQTRSYLNGNLIREKMTGKIYVLENQVKKRIFSLSDLRKSYFGQPIFDLDYQGLILYPDKN
ncbi:MAG: hypothetical protein US83_C0004G0011 [Candidatus Falkowbacteria bacterium GW2011_GWC2_38_22]|uniref:Uncharacterized protein n=1 Tax=Candidatus Falkowbacteria bacterium GW2011_GWE1_38_31 TaxID=1618638 RepID=A0A0G0N0L4_9BACT|nr:MAG: hypothetical protein US73_C0002G0106 [Candidatus Falkowbacteria bacterium GW2011_GWF2_38_1205]KKQ61627.1 MAG: hypothetical protein US83_C0004G0011 [Candidatus Falkowbacteria bacterium GW2011_GWC2_38_22]KKQ63758.1 MAG: hypothetical protein US84_C0004G0106 [Candidatus Falkowbacteria bacterium GW2011_GWF1_38_22]KKQ65826.1 MAG: hypothetical protein US87_C0004G0011 [Candidatus Falkowbacteria bacterium GW2011_GWE2_38_254]KKQ70621.1 MAG: hypothetical protein US91_C0004G0106 [Candidatus Falkowb